MGLISFGPIQTSPISMHVSKLAFAETLTHHFHCTVLKVANTNNTPHLQFFSNSKFKSTLCLFCLGISLPLICSAEPKPIFLSSIALQATYEDHDEQPLLPQDLGYDPNFVPDSVKSFVVHLYHQIRDKNVYEIHQLYEASFQALSERHFKDTPWPSVDAVSQYVDNDHVFCLLYREMWFRHFSSSFRFLQTFSPSQRHRFV
jgi:hypothetical protein